MRGKEELDEALLCLGFRFDPQTGGYRKRGSCGNDDMWVSATQAREALAAAENDQTWVEDDVEALSESIAQSLIAAGIGE